MGKRSGLGQQLAVVAIGSGPAYNVSGDIGSIDSADSMFALLDYTGIDKSAHERLPGLGDSKLQYTAYHNNASGGQHAVVSPLKGTPVRAFWLGSTTEGDGLAFVVNGILSDYAMARATGGGLTTKVTADGYNGDFGDWGTLGLIGTSASGTNNHTAMDMGFYGPSLTISANTLANPTVVQTSTAHGLTSGDSVNITGSNSTPSINGDWVATVVDGTHFTVPVNVTVAGTAGTVVKTSSRLGCVLVAGLYSIGSGTNYTIKAQHSADNGVVDAYADIAGVVTTSLTAAAAESRIRSSGTTLVKRYVRLVDQGAYSSANAIAVFRRIQGAE